MSFKEKHYFLLLFLLALFFGGCESRKTMFSLLPADKTGITFTNRISETDTMNILSFEYIYNGGGVAAGDFNNDGLQDLFFTGNQVSNKLYLNKGDFKFEDITITAGVDGNGKWCSGVALVDINNDGLMDIYVGATVKKKEADRANLLYVNQGPDSNGIPVFKEKAAEYGIADTGHTTNAAFFDFDNDGDLDLYVLTNTLETYPRYHKKITDGSSPTTDRLYRNDWNEALQHGVYTNVSREAGIQIEGYGLGLNITDINRDGWKDIYVTNDYVSNDLLYINNGNGTFTDRAGDYFKHISNTAMGNDINDINNDGLVDVVAVDMLPRDNTRKKMLMGASNYHNYINNETYGYVYEYGRNTLQLNQGSKPGSKEPIFSDISLMANVAETDWSWTTSLVDFDHDGYRDLIVTNGFPKDITDRDFIQYQAQVSSVASKEMLLSQIPAVKIKNYAFKNNGDLTFSEVTNDWGMAHPSFSNGAVYVDLDNDGDLDYVVNNIDDPAFVYRNNMMEKKPENANYLRIRFQGEKNNKMGLGTFVELAYGNGQKQVYEHTIYRGYLSTVESIAHFGTGKTDVIDEVKVIWPNGTSQILKQVKANQVLTVDVKNAKELPENYINNEALFTEITDSLHIDFRHQETDHIDFNLQKLLPHKLSQFGPSVSVGDVNGDGLEDFFIGGAKAVKGKFMIQTADGSFAEKDLLPDSGDKAKEEEDMGTMLFDADSDGDLDLYIASGSIENQSKSAAYQDRLYTNDGKGNFSLATDALPAFAISSSCVKGADYDRDGDLDLFVGGRVLPGFYPQPVSSYILRNDSENGKAKFTDITHEIAPNLNNIGMVCDALWTDYDNDGWVDLLLAGEWMPLTFLKNNNGKFEKGKQQPEISHKVGWWNSLMAADFDSDGDMDYIAGNLGRNTLTKASEKEPVSIYAKDFDNNGSYDAIPTAYFPDAQGVKKEYTFHGREDLIKQMIAIKRTFPLYKDFAQATIEQIIKKEDLQNALVLRANYLESAYLENKGNGNFKVTPLPTEAQMAPLFGMITSDFDQDGYLDALLVGNDFGNEVMIGRYDAMNGLLLKGNGKGGFIPQSIQNSGFYVPGNAKALVQLVDNEGKQLVIASQNRGKLCIFKNNKPVRSIQLQAADAYALLTFQNGKTQKEELPYGSSFLSQSSRQLLINEQIKEVEIVDYKGNKRKVFPAAISKNE